MFGLQMDCLPVKLITMKKQLLLMVCFSALILLPSCRSSVKSDAEAAATLACKIQSLVRNSRFEDSMDERVELEMDAQQLERKLKEKYSAKTEWQQFMEAYYIALNKCAALELQTTGKR